MTATLRDGHVFLEAGQLFLSSEPASVSTVLGSCVAVCLWDPVRRTGGINHFVLPRMKSDDTSLRYGEPAIDRLVEGMLGLGCRRDILQAKVFGGANVLPVNGAGVTVGERNCRFAFQRLSEHDISVAAHRVGGLDGLFVRYSTHDGVALVRGLGRGAPANGDAPPESVRRHCLSAAT